LTSGSGVSSRIRHKARSLLKQLRRNWMRARHGFDAGALRDRLVSLGIRPGDTIMVHSSFDRFEAFRGTPTDVIDVLMGIVGPAGTVMMPTIPFTGSAVDYVRGGPVFDVRRTPSQMGLLPELFRRRADSVRSVHPTHSVAAAGRLAASITRGHASTATPCGVGSPYHALLEHDGRILLLGTGIRALTFYHAVEEILEPSLPFSPFTTGTFTLQSRDHDQNIVTNTTRLFEPSVSRRRNLDILVPELKQRGEWRSTRIGTLEAVLLDARDVLETCTEMASRGYYCYDAG
jgi:aminoglycoside 3-N-acetyltransferase